MKKFNIEIKLLTNCRKQTRVLLLKEGDKDFIRAIVDAIWTTLDGKVPLTEDELLIVRRNQDILRKIASKNTSLKQKRVYLTSKRGQRALISLLNIIKDHF